MIAFDSATRFLLLSDPRPITDRATSLAVVDEHGAPLHTFRVLAVIAGQRPSQVSVKAPAPASPLEVGMPIKFEKLRGVIYDRDRVQAVSFRADRAAQPTKTS